MRPCIPLNRPLGSWNTDSSKVVKYPIQCIVILFVTSFVPVVSGCSRDAVDRLHGTWIGKTRIDQDITITIGKDSTIAIETADDSVRKVQRGTYQIVDRRIRISLDSLETYTESGVKRERKTGADEAVFTLTMGNELILRRGLQAIVLQKSGDAP